MNTNPNAKVILCYGDSNVWGQKPDKTGRYAPDVRWTGVLQQRLGDDFYIIEEGLGSRTTDLDYKRPGRNGKTYLQPCLESQNPIDTVVLMLGTNDLKIQYDRSPQDIAAALRGLIELIREYGKNADRQAPKILLLGPMHINADAPHFHEFYDGIYDRQAAEKSTQLAAEIKKLAEEESCNFFDAASVARPGDDGTHMDEPSHPRLGEALALQIGADGSTFEP